MPWGHGFLEEIMDGESHCRSWWLRSPLGWEKGNTKVSGIQRPFREEPGVRNEDATETLGNMQKSSEVCGWRDPSRLLECRDLMRIPAHVKVTDSQVCMWVWLKREGLSFLAARKVSMALICLKHYCIQILPKQCSPFNRCLLHNSSMNK